MLKNAGPVWVLFIALLASNCSRSSSATGEAVVYGPTEVGTPIGEAVARVIGADGGTVSSADGRLTLIVPQGALAETVSFTIQPITNNLQTGIGSAYRLGPDGSTFSTPLQLSIRYDERDLEGTAVEALAIAFQDREGKWNAIEPASRDDANKSITFAITHFTDFSFLSKFRLEPSKATLRVGETMQIKLIGCAETDTIFGIEMEPGVHTCIIDRGRKRTHYFMQWYADVGTITADINPAIYTAPPRKPSPNMATVAYPYSISEDGFGERIDPVLPNYEFAPVKRGILTTKITIVDWGYRVSGEGGGLTYKGMICNLEKPFTVYGSAYNYNFNFTPANESGGTWEVNTTISVASLKGGGTYSIEGLDTDNPRLKVIGDVTATVPYATRTGGGIHYFDLTPVDANECKG